MKHETENMLCGGKTMRGGLAKHAENVNTMAWHGMWPVACMAWHVK